ncbi:MAG TPA: DNA recombination protein RmuC, partial [Phenylobacterium sp.]
MNVLLILTIVLALTAAVAIAWALKERSRAQAADLKTKLLEGQGELLRAQVTQSAAGVAEEILRRNEEQVRNREQLAQARLEAQLKPVADTLKLFQEQVTAVEKA